MPPPSGYLTFNQFFARHVKPGVRPIAELDDDTVLVSPADSTYIGAWTINDKSELQVDDDRLDLKGLRWSIHELLQGSEYADRFKGGIFTHSFLKSTDYHRWHTPVRGKVVEARSHSRTSLRRGSCPSTDCRWQAGICLGPAG